MNTLSAATLFATIACVEEKKFENPTSLRIPGDVMEPFRIRALELKRLHRGVSLGEAAGAAMRLFLRLPAEWQSRIVTQFRDRSPDGRPTPAEAELAAAFAREILEDRQSAEGKRKTK